MNVKKIDTRHGTANQSSFSNGNCLPLTSMPHPMNYFAPQTNGSRGSWWFHPDDVTFEGIRLTHQASPWVGDFGYLLLQPVSGDLLDTSLWGTTSSYNKKTAKFTPYELEIEALRFNLKTKVTPSLYGGKIQIDYNQPTAALVLHLTENHFLEQIDDTHVRGWVSNYAACEDPDFKMMFVIAFTEKIIEFKENRLYFGDIKQQTIHIATSFISDQQARLNLEREHQLSYAEMKQNCQECWNEKLNRIELRHSNEMELATFYHNLYRAFLFPTRFYELDSQKQPYHYQTVTKTVERGVYYTNNGFWDTSKTVYPLYSLIAVPELEEMLEAFLNVYRETGYLPKWLAPDERGMMPGTLIDSVFADALTKGIRSDLLLEALSAMLHSATVTSSNQRYGREGISVYNQLGYIPNQLPESINQTLDYSYSDYCIAQVAELAGETAIATDYLQKSKNYRQLINRKTCFMEEKDSQGKSPLHFSAIRWGGAYTEGSAWQNSLNAYHDIRGYMEAIGGKERLRTFLTKLSNQKPLFEIGSYGFEIHEMSEMAALDFGQIALSNQPSFHVPYLFNYVDAPSSTQVLIKGLCQQAFSADWDGYPGDEDNGSMASWYIFSTLGFYPVCPGSGEYQIGIPLFDYASIQLSNGKVFEIITTPNEKQHQFVTKKYFQNQCFEETSITHKQLTAGGKMIFELGIVPAD